MGLAEAVGLKLFEGVWLPDGETHLTAWMTKMQQRDEEGRLCYQKHKLDALLGLVTDFRIAIDVGAHCGLMSMHLTKRFQTVHAFEPVELHRAAFARNVTGPAVLHAMALGEAEGMVSMKSDPHSSGDTVVCGVGEIPLRRLDDVLPEVEGVGLIKLDCEGYELHALRGGEQLLKRCKPAIMVEQKKNKAQQFGLPETGAVQYLEGLGAKVRKVISGDYLLTW